MAEYSTLWWRPRFWIILVGIVILLIFLYFYEPFNTYIIASIPNVRFGNVVFWFASLIGVVGYAISHWQSFRRNIVHNPNASDLDGLVFATLQITIMTAVIFCAGATLQGVVMLGEHLMEGGVIISSAFGGRLLSIILLMILTILFYLLHLLVRVLRFGWKPRRAAPRTPSAVIR